MEFKLKSNICPVCGFDLMEDPWEGEIAKDELICPSCGIQFGYDDAIRYESSVIKVKERYRDLRESWINNGMSWHDSCTNKPNGWNPNDQLENIPKELR